MARREPSLAAGEGLENHRRGERSRVRRRLSTGLRLPRHVLKARRRGAARTAAGGDLKAIAGRRTDRRSRLQPVRRHRGTRPRAPRRVTKTLSRRHGRSRRALRRGRRRRDTLLGPRWLLESRVRRVRKLRLVGRRRVRVDACRSAVRSFVSAPRAGVRNLAARLRVEANPEVRVRAVEGRAAGFFPQAWRAAGGGSPGPLFGSGC